MAKAKSRSRLNDVTGNPGPGLFFDQRARLSTARAYRMIRRFLRSGEGQKLSFGWGDARAIMKPALPEIARRYWANHDYDRRITFSEIKSDAKHLREHLRRLHVILDALPRPLVQVLNNQVSRRVGGSPGRKEYLADFRAASTMLKRASKTIATRKNKKNASASAENACAALWGVWETVTGQPFVRQWETGETAARYVKDRGSREFVGVDALFVQVSLRAIDSDRVAQAKSKSG